MKNFSQLWKESWKEYKLKLRTSLKLYLVLLILIPIALLLIAGITALPMLFTKSPYSVIPLVLFLPFLIIGFIVSYVIFYIALIRYSLLKPKEQMKELIKGSYSYFWRFLGLSLLIMLICFAFVIVGVAPWIFLKLSYWFLVLIIPMDIALFMMIIYLTLGWSFSSYILIGENTKIIKSMKESRNVIKKNWWHVFGYVLLVGIIVSVVSMVFSLPAEIMEKLIKNNISALFILIYVIAAVLNIIGSMLITPFTVFFIKNLYVDMKLFRKKF